MTVYRPYIATWYGPGFFGQRMACGHTLHRNTLGVANKTLPVYPTRWCTPTAG